MGSAISEYANEKLNIVFCFTDGEENSSKKYKYNNIKNQIEHLQNEKQWIFHFYGADIQTWDDNNNNYNFGIKNTHSVDFNSNVGVTNMMRSVSQNITNSIRTQSQRITNISDEITEELYDNNFGQYIDTSKNIMGEFIDDDETNNNNNNNNIDHTLISAPKLQRY